MCEKNNSARRYDNSVEAWQNFDEKIKDLKPAEQAAVKMFWRSLVLRSQRTFSEGNGRLPHYNAVLGGAATTADAIGNGNMRSCNCCPYGYHIDLDFVRYCEALANAKPSEDELRRRCRRRSRKSMEFMLGLESIFDQWDVDQRVQAVPELPHESESESPRPAYTSFSQQNTTMPGYTLQRPRSSSVPRFTTYGGPSTRAESPFGTASSTCSSMRGAESDIPYTTYARRQIGFAANSPPETRAFLHDALDEVCSDFERTLERASMRRKKVVNGGPMSYSVGSDRNNNSTINGYGGKRNGYAWEQSFDIFDSCVAGNKSPRASRSYTRSNTLPFQQKLSPAEQRYESYVQATVAANAKSPVEQLLSAAATPKQITPPPPPPPRRNGAQAKITSPTSTTSADCAKSPQSVSGTSALLSPVSIQSTNDNAAADAQTLYNIRQQMALSLKRMKDLEEQVKTIPEMQFQLSQLRMEKQRLEQTLQHKQEELQRARETMRPSNSPSPLASPKFATSMQFTPQRISPISLESLGSLIRSSSVTSNTSEKQQKTNAKRDIGTMPGLYSTRDVAVGSPTVRVRTVGTSPAQSLRITDLLYTQIQLNEQVDIAVRTYEEQRSLQNLKKLISVGTQMYIAKPDVRDNCMQTAADRAVQRYSIGVTVKPNTHDNFVSCKPQTRDIGSSEHRITDVLCKKCATPKRTVGCSTEDTSDPRSRAAVSFKLLELTGRSNTFNLGDTEKLNIKRKTIGTQYTPAVVHNIGSQTSLAVVHSIGVQNSPEMQNMSTQSQADVNSKQTDTRDLIRLCATQTSKEEIKPEKAATPPLVALPKPIIETRTIEVEVPAKRPPTRETASNTVKSKTTDRGVNTMLPATTRHSGSNTDTVRKRDVGCGDIVKPHISIACADNYCDSCKDAIKNLAKDFTTVTKIVPPASPLPTKPADNSKIPRPKHLTSPSPVRKPYKRQNTYTITPSPTPSPISQKKTMSSSLQEKPPAISSLESSPETQSFLSASASHKISQSTTKTTLGEPIQAEEEIVHTQEPTSQDMPAYDLTPLIVKEEKRVSISWSRDNSPAPLSQSKDGRKSLESSFNEKMKQALEREETKVLRVDEEGAAACQPPSTLKSSRIEAESTEASKAENALLQKLATVEAKPREKYTPSKDLQTALKVINDSLLKKMCAKPFSSSSLKASKSTIQTEWFRISSTDKANPHEVEDYLDYFESLSVPLLEYCVNLADGNGNTAMHYAVSHGNFDVVSILLDSKVCNVNQMNNAGYTCVMLVSLAKLKNASHRTVVQRLFQMADVNIRAKKHCQTALMLAVSHGNSDMVQMLLAAGADINIQDEDGSTALMCAAEHGRIDIVKQLLSQADCDSLIQDVDGSTAFKIAWQAGHRDIGLLLYVHEQMLRSKMPNRGGESTARTPTMISPKHKRQPSQ